MKVFKSSNTLYGWWKWICPFSLDDRSIVLSGNIEINVTPYSDARIFIDGNIEYPMAAHDTFTVSLKNDSVYLFKKVNFFQTIQNKLHWNQSIK